MLYVQVLGYNMAGISVGIVEKFSGDDVTVRNIRSFTPKSFLQNSSSKATLNRARIILLNPKSSSDKPLIEHYNFS